MAGRDRDDHSGRGRDDDRGSRYSRDDGGRDRGNRDDTPRRGRDDDRGERGGRDRDSRGSTGSGSGFQYQGRSKEQVEKRRTQSSNDFDRFLKDHIKVWSPKVGSNRVRILPPTWKNPEHYAHDIYVHYGVGPDRQSYLDLDKMKGEADPITEERAEMLRSGSSKEDVNDLDSKKRALVYIIDRDDEGEGVQAWAMPWSLDRDISTLSTDRETNEVLEIDNPKDGYDIEFDKRGEGIKTKYSGVSVARRSSSLGRAEWLDFAVDNPLPDQLVFYSYDEIAKAFGGGGAHRERGRDDDRSDRGNRSSSRESEDDRDDRSTSRSGRDRDRDNDRGGHSDNRDERGSDRGGRSRDDRNGSVGKTPTWAEVHDMTGEELDALCESDDALRDLKPNEFDTDAELADEICSLLRIDKPQEGRGRRAGAADPDQGDKLRQMREERGRR